MADWEANPLTSTKHFWWWALVRLYLVSHSLSSANQIKFMPQLLRWKCVCTADLLFDWFGNAWRQTRRTHRLWKMKANIEWKITIISRQNYVFKRERWCVVNFLKMFNREINFPTNCNKRAGHHCEINPPLRILFLIDTVNQGNWCLSIKLRVECFVIVA